MKRVIVFGLAAWVACGSAHAEITKAPQVTTKMKVVAETVAKDFDWPWGLAFLPNSRALITEREGRLRFVNGDGRVSAPISGVPAVSFEGQGGLLDVAVSPDFKTNNLIYLSYSEPRAGGVNGTTVARAKLVSEGQGGRLENLEVIFRQQPGKDANEHFGGRFLFMPDGSFFLTLGERASWPYEAQNPDNDLGKLVRLEADGRPYHGNPKLPGWKPEIWSIGHRNMQGVALHPVTGQVWTIEHGAMGGDEVNIDRPGKNYGWPVITYGVNYNGEKIGEGTHKDGLEQPVYYWDPSIAPSGAAFYTGTRIPEWRNNLFVAALKDATLHRLVLEGDKVVGEEVLLKEEITRVRTVRMGPDGALWVVIESSAPWGRIMRLNPAP